MNHSTNLRKFSHTAAAVALILASHSGLWAGSALQATADIRFRGTSTLHGFDGSLPSPVFSVQLSEKAGTSAMVVNAEVVVQVAELTTDNEKRDRKMRTMLNSDEFPVIKVSVTDAPVPEGSSGEVTLLLQIRDRSEPVKAMISDWREENGNISFTLTFSVSLKTFELKPPSFMGVIRVGDEVSVTCDVHPLSKGEESTTVQKAQ